MQHLVLLVQDRQEEHAGLFQVTSEIGFSGVAMLAFTVIVFKREPRPFSFPDHAGVTAP